MLTKPEVVTELENDRDCQKHEKHENPKESSQIIHCWKQEELPEYVRFMRIHGDSPMV